MSNNFETVWERIPFNGGVNYHCGTLTITGEYSQNNPLMFEGDCCQWILESRCGAYKLAYDSLKEAQDAADYLEF
jgi:hypothetical protein